MDGPNILRCSSRYFARNWLNPQPLDPQILSAAQESVRRRLAILQRASPPILSRSTISHLEGSLPKLFHSENVQVLTHGDLSLTNILVDEDTCAITGIIDWSTASVRPFGLELDVLFLMSGYMDMEGWHDYSCREKIHTTFWHEFWNAIGLEGQMMRDEVRVMAETAAQIGAILRYAFQRDESGAPTERTATSEVMLKYLKAMVSD